MAEPSLEGCREKHARGQAYLERLLRLLDEYTADPSPHRVVVRFDAERRELIFTGEVVKPMTDLLRWGCILGDAVQNLRAALDHLVWQLVLLDTGKDGTNEHQFPICDSGGAYWSITKKGTPSTRDRLLRGIKEHHRAKIDAFQPYRIYAPPAIMPLSALRDLSNHDKHRLIHTALFVLEQSASFELHPNANAGEPTGPPVVKPFVEGEAVEVMTVPFSAPGADPKVTVHGNPTVEIGFDPHRIRAEHLPEIPRHVGEVIESVAADFP
jgi:hypothetical protein